MSKILFIYPNKDLCPMIPLGISVIAGVLKDAGHRVDVFDTTFIAENAFHDNNAREQLNFVKKVDTDKYWGLVGEGKVEEKLTRKICDFGPDIIGVSIVENNYYYARALISHIRQHCSIPIIVGGVFPTVAPQFFIDDENVDIICIGEGERPMLELVSRVDSKKDYRGIKNLIVKTVNGPVVNELGDFYDWNPPSVQNIDIFDQRHLLKPFVGKIWRTGYFELSRGCPYQCSYCVNAAYQKIFKGSGKYRREKNIYDGISEIAYIKNKYELELVWFHDENFAMMPEKRFEMFCAEYNKKINLPYFAQSSADTLQDEEKVRKLKESGCATIAIGLEVGNEEFRKNILNKTMKNSAYLKAFQNCRKYSIRTTANMMIGFSEESEDNILETIDFCKKCNADSIGVSVLAPYYGTKIRDSYIKKGLMEDKCYPDISLYYKSMVMLNIPIKRFEYIYHNFSDLVYGNKQFI